MKKAILILVSLVFYTSTFSQTISFEDPISIKWPANDSVVNVDFYITNQDSTKYKIKVKDLHKGSAVAGKDYQFNSVYLTDIIEHATFPITIKANSKKINRTLRIAIYAFSEDTSFNAETQIVLTGDPEKVKPIDITNRAKLEFVNYTDFKGYEQEQPNGVAQSQFLFKLPINKHYKLWKDGDTKRQWFRSFIMPNFIFNRIDKSNEPVKMEPTYSKYGDSAVLSPVINTFDFLRYSNFILNTKLVVFTIIRPDSRFQFQLNGSLYKIKIDSAKITKGVLGQDSLFTNKDTTTALNPVWAQSFGADLYYDTHFTDFPFNFRFILGAIIIKSKSSEYRQADVASTLPDNSQKTALLIGKNHKFSSPIWTFSATVTKSLDLKKASSTENHYLFFRYNYSWQSFNGNVLKSRNPVIYEKRRLNNNYSQFQFGIDLNFDEFFKN